MVASRRVNMEAQKYCVYNQTRESFISFGVTIVNTILEPVKPLIQKLSIEANRGLWLTPYRGIPMAQGLHLVDLVYLDEDFRVLHKVESFSMVFNERLKLQAASALILPAHSIYSSQTEAADQLMICGAEQMEHRLGHLSSQIAGVPITPRTDFLTKVPPSIAGSASHLSGDHGRQMQRAAQQLKDKEEAESEAGKKDSFMPRFLRWLAIDPRKARRYPLPGLVAYYWTVGTPKARSIGDISATGLYLFTDEPWLPGSMIPMTLQRAGTPGQAPEDWVAVLTQVVRSDTNGRGLAFVFSRFVNVYSGEIPPESVADKKVLERFLRQLKLPKRDE